VNDERTELSVASSGVVVGRVDAPEKVCVDEDRFRYAPKEVAVEGGPAGSASSRQYEQRRQGTRKGVTAP
jgi:hypothetical protein